ncbi:hypothetical protein FM120_02165 [Sphingobacterium faecium PCAi_F2.5]|nr:hypothetical protein FM120_02165 [Sphingobacterium faecium PCAi_F2.5]
MLFLILWYEVKDTEFKFAAQCICAQSVFDRIYLIFIKLM